VQAATMKIHKLQIFIRYTLGMKHVEDFPGSNVMMSRRFIAWGCLSFLWENGWKDTEVVSFLGFSAC
jgi:hypothetical protein